MSGRFSCHICAEFFENGSDLQKHLTLHGQVSQKVQCQKCDRVLSKKSNLKAHVESVHCEVASKFICHPCQKSFSNAGNLKRHLASTSHSGVDKLPEVKRQRPTESTCTSANVRWVFSGWSFSSCARKFRIFCGDLAHLRRTVWLYLLLLVAVIRVWLPLRQFDRKITSRAPAVTGSFFRVNYIYFIVLS